MNRRLFLAMLGALLLVGCATPPPVNYYYGSYSRALYHAKKDGTPASIESYKKALRDVIDKSQKKNFRVPPGISCEYAFLLAKEGNPDAETYFALEVQTYPEATRFVEFLRAQLKKSTSQP